jgi:hypothetical protein
MYKTLEEAQQATVSRRMAIQEVMIHGVDLSEFNRDVGIKDTYTGKEILDWLGY